VLGAILIAVSGAAALATVSMRTQEASGLSDPREEPPFVRLVTAARATGTDRGFTGIIGARVQSNIGFRVPGKIVERLVDVGQAVKAGQLLMRIDDTDLGLALTAKRNAVAAAGAIVVQTQADERRYASLLDDGWIPRQLYEQAKAAMDTAEAQLAAAEAEARVAENEATYAVLVANADGTVVKRSASQDRSSPPARPSFDLRRPALEKQWSRFRKPSGQRSARWPRPASMGAIGVAIRHISASCLTPPMPRLVPMRPAMCSTVRPRQHRLARR
jgi:multidrug efflux pump subunit AcrA (membrane-fusion protein)